MRKRRSIYFRLENMDQKDHKWYVLSVHSGKEDFVVEKIQQMIATQGLKQYFSDLVVPKQSKIVVKDGKKVLQKKRMLAGYVLIKMLYSNMTAPMITNIEEVRGFVRIGDTVYPLTEEEVDRMRNEKPESQSKQKVYATTIRMNDAVKITDGAFKDWLGKVAAVDEAKGRVKILITFMGRENPIDLDMTQVQKL